MYNTVQYEGIPSQLQESRTTSEQKRYLPTSRCVQQTLQNVLCQERGFLSPKFKDSASKQAR